MTDNAPRGPQPPESDSLSDLLRQSTAAGKTFDVMDAPDAERKRKGKPKRSPKTTGKWLRRLLIAGALILAGGCLATFYMIIMSDGGQLNNIIVITVPVVITSTPESESFTAETQAGSPAPPLITAPAASYALGETVMLNAVIEDFPIGTRVTVDRTWFDGVTRWYSVVTDTGAALEVSAAQLSPAPTPDGG